MKTIPTECLTYTVEEAAALLGVGRGTAYAAVRSGELPSVRLGRRVLIPKYALAALLGVNDGGHTSVNGKCEPVVSGLAEKEREGAPHGSE